MGEFCANEEISGFHLDSQQVGHISRNFCQLEGQKYGRKHLVYSDAVRTTGSHSEHNLICSSIDDIFSSILILTSYISRRFIYFIEDLVFRDVGRSSQTFAILSSGQHQRFPCSSCCQYVLEDRSISSCVASDGGSSLRSCKKKVSGLEEDKDVNIPVEVIETNHNILGGPSIFQGLMFPLFGFRLACRIAVACLRYSFLHVRRTQIQIQSLIYRLQRTLHGSSDDIGWLQQASGVLPVEDGTARFMELLRGIRSGEHSLPNSFVYLLIPGLFSNHSPLYFVNTKRFFSKMGLACHIAKIHSEASVDHNAWILKQYIEELYWGSSKRVLLLGHSKGGVDAAAALSLYWSELEDKVAGLALVQSPYGGTPIASDILREGQIADKETWRIMELLICRLIKGDMRALEDLTYEKRKEFIMKHKLPEQIPLVSFHTEASIAPGVLSTMSHIAHAELPWLPLPSFLNEESGLIQAGCKVPVVVPLAAAMAISALHLQLRYGEKSDGLVTCRDAEVPGSVVVKPDRKLDHAWMVYSSKKNNGEPDACEMSEALLTLLVEIGKMKQKQKSTY